MIRLFVLVGIVGGLLIAYLATFAVGPISQLPPPESLLTGFRAEGFVPKSVNLAEDDSVEHDIFEVPEEDARQLKMAQAAMSDMPGMKMEDMKTESNGAPKMKLNPDGTMKTNPDGSMVMEEEEKPHGEDEAAGGLKIAEDGDFDREIDLKMTEWKYSKMNIEVKKGERIRFNLINDGEILHEFMIMEMSAMRAIRYRVNRADWSLLEHEALLEKSLMLPGGEFSFVMEVQEEGVWMFMCMLPYHMEMGMMGQIATAGNAMEM
ncbi:MAG: multicopper oxidase domain-containing protein [Rhizobiaceae bacterium]|nr:multicopper oxidase domain-containing protein [Rhizobiaceae bacterium]